MTRDEYRKACLEAIKIALRRTEDLPFPDYEESTAATILDSLHGIARVNPIEATEEMIGAIGPMAARIVGESRAITAWRAMSTAGDLTNPPEGKQ